MTFVLKVDMQDSGAPAKISAIEQGLTQARDAAGRFKTSGTAATTAVAKGASEAADELDKAKKSSDGLGDSLGDLIKMSNPFAGLVDVFEREANILERIRGPMREHRADMDALERLYKKGAVSAAEFETEMQRLIKASGSMQGPARGPAAAGPNPFGGLTAVFEQEAAMLEKIKGPMRQYYTDLVTLDALHKKNAISTREFNTEMEKLTKGRRPLGMDTALASQTIGLPSAPRASATGSVTGDWLSTFAAGGGILTLGRQLESIVQQMHDTEDAFIGVSNEVMKYTDATHNSTVIMSEQIAMAHELQTSLHSSMGLYDAVRDGTDELNFSHREQLRMMKTIGQAFTLEGKSTEAAANFMEKFAYSLTSGTVNALELRRAMRQVPEIANLWTERFGVTKNELIEMTQNGKISVEQLAQALTTETKAIDDNFAKRQRTHAQMKEEFILNEKLAFQRLDNAGIDVVRGRGMAAMDDIRSKWSMVSGSYNSATNVAFQGYDVIAAEEAQKSISAFINVADDATAAAGRAGQAISAGLVKAFKELANTVPQAISQVESLGRAMGLVADPWAAQEGKFAQAVQTMTRINEPANSARQELTRLNAVFKTGAIDAESYRQEYNQLVTTINDGRLPDTIRIWESLNDPAKEYALTLAALNSLYKSGRIDAQQYNSELNKTVETLTKANKEYSDQTRAIRGVAIGERNIGGVGVSVGADVQEQRQTRPQTVMEAAAAVSDAAMFTREYAEQLERQRAISSSIHEPMRIYEQELEAINGALQDNSITQAYANKLTKEAGEAYRDSIKSMTWEKAGVGELIFERMKGEAEAFNDTIASKVISNLDRMGESLITFAQGGEVAWGDMVDSMISDLGRLLIKQLEIMAITALMNSLMPGSGTAATSSGVTGSVVDSIATRTAGPYPTPAGTSSMSSSVVSPSAPVNVSIYNVQDKDVGAASIQGRQGQRSVLNVMRMNRGWGS